MIQFSQETFLVVNKANNKEGLGPDTVNWHNWVCWFHAANFLNLRNFNFDDLWLSSLSERVLLIRPFPRGQIVVTEKPDTHCLAGAYWSANEQRMAILPTKRRANEQSIGGWAPVSCILFCYSLQKTFTVRQGWERHIFCIIPEKVKHKKNDPTLREGNFTCSWKIIATSFSGSSTWLVFVL